MNAMNFLMNKPRVYCLLCLFLSNMTSGSVDLLQNSNKTNATPDLSKSVGSVQIPASDICTRIKSLSAKQMRFCEDNPDSMDSILKGFELGVDECKYQFRKRRWNCTLLGAESPFGRRAVPGTKEAAFTHAIISAGIAQAVTLACTKGNLTRCGCDNTKIGSSREGWKWGGCSVNIQRGLSVADQFLNGNDAGRSDIALMNRHNNEVGREAVRSSLVIWCKCHGYSKSCTLRTCWTQLASIRTVSNQLTTMYTTAAKRVKVELSSLVLKDDKYTKAQRLEELVYINDSPSYCRKNVSIGLPGTVGRTCQKVATNGDADICDVMCCGRGYDTHMINKMWKCKCKFVWCCFVKCKTCSEHVIVHTCK